MIYKIFFLNHTFRIFYLCFKEEKIYTSKQKRAEKTAEICIHQLFKYDALIIPGFGNKINWLMLKLFPVWLRLILFRRMLVKEIRVSPLRKSPKLAS